MSSTRIFGSPPPRSSRIRRRWRRLGWAVAGGALALGGAAAVQAACRLLQPSDVWAWTAFGALAIVGVAMLGWWQHHPGRHLVAGSLVAGMMVGMASYALKAPARSQGPLDPNRQTAERVVRLKQALERRGDYRSSQATSSFYPPTRDFLAFALAQPQGAALLTSPWRQVRQANRVAPDPRLGLPTAAQRQAGIAAPALGTDLGPGLEPRDGRFTAHTFGALVYDRDDRTGRYVLYGIGRRAEQAVLVGLAEGEP